jgi:hypothetical protein
MRDKETLLMFAKEIGEWTDQEIEEVTDYQLEELDKALTEHGIGQWHPDILKGITAENQIQALYVKGIQELWEASPDGELSMLDVMMLFNKCKQMDDLVKQTVETSLTSH